MKNLCLILNILFFLFLGTTLSSQTTNDFRTQANGNWSVTTTWERFNGSGWENATYYPGNGTTNNVSINHTITANVVVNISTSNLTVNGALTVTTLNFTANGTTTINGTFTDNSNTGITTFGSLVLSGNGTFTSNAVVTPGNMVVGNNLLHNSSGLINIGALNIGGNLTINGGGIFRKTAGGSLMTGGSTLISSSSSIELNSNSLCQFNGLISTTGSSSFTSTSVATAGNLLFLNGISHQSTGNISINTADFGTNNQEIEIANNTGNITMSGTLRANSQLTIKNIGDGTGAGTITLSGITIGADITLINRRNVIVNGTLNGTNANSTWINEVNSTLDYRATATPMATGLLNAVASGNSVLYSANGGQTIKLTDYFHLRTSIQSGTVNSNKNLETKSSSITISGNLTINQYTTLLHSSADAIQTLNLKGQLINNGTVTLQSSTSRYCDLTIEAIGDIITGTGTTIMRLRNLTLTGAGVKSVSYYGIIDFYSGIDANAFTNNGGEFTAFAGTFRFIDAFSIAGTGAITLNNLQCGNNNQTIQVLDRDVTVNGILTLNHNTLVGGSPSPNSYLNLNGKTLTVLGGFTRTNSGEFGGSANSNLVLGNGTTPAISGTINFETGVDQLNTLTHNVINGASFYSIGAPLTITNLNITSGQLNNTSNLSVTNLNLTSGQLNNTANLTITNSYSNNGIYNQTAGSTIFNKPGGSIAIAGSGTHTFGNFQISDGTVTTANNISIGLNFINNSNSSQSFTASAGAVSFTRAGDQFIQGTGTGTVSFFDLIFSAQATNRNRFLATNFSVTNLMQINNGNLVYLDNNAPRNINVNNIVVGGGSSGQFLVSATAISPVYTHQITINGNLTVNSGATFNMRNATTRYADVTMTGSGTILQGTGNISFHSLLLTGASNKNFNNTSAINFYSGTNTPNQFINNGGAFTSTGGTLVFRDNLTDWTIGGNGSINLQALQIGAGTTTNVTLSRDIIIEGNLIFNLSAATNYLALNGFTLTLNGNHTRQQNGRIRGGDSSKLVINGNGNFTSTFAFDQTTVGTTNRFAQVDFNRAGDGNMVLGNLLETDILNLQQGLINSAAGSIQVNSQTNLINGSFIDNNNTGTNSFNGIFTVSSNSQFNPTSTSPLSLSGTIQNDGVFIKDGTGTTTFTTNTVINGTKTINFANGAVSVSNNTVVTNNVNAEETGTYIFGLLNGTNGGSQWVNQGILTFINATQPMATGSLNASFAGNKVIYSRIQNTQTIKSATYHHLIVNGGGLRTLTGNIQVNGDLTIGEETFFNTAEYQVAGTTTGILTMMESSELRIGRDQTVLPQPLFPTGFTRENMVFDPVSLVSYNGRNQDLSHIPVYSNLAITLGYTKTMTGNITVNGFLNITAGTLAFSSGQTQNLTVYGDLYGTGGTINMSGGSLPHILDLYGSINQVNRFSIALNSRVRYLSTDAQQIFSPTGGDYYGKLEVNGGSIKFLELDTEIRGELIINSGIIQLGDRNLTLNSASATAVPITGTFSNTNMIETNGLGRLIKRGTGGAPYNYLLGIYPVGSGEKYSPLNITSIGGSTNNTNFQVRSVTGRHQSVPSTFDALLRHWDITTTVTSPTINASFTFSPLDVIGDPAKYKAYSWNGSTFVNPSGSSVTGNSITYPTGTSIPLQVTAYDPETVRKTLYSYKDGPWDDPDTWTTDPSGQNLENPAVPSSSENVVILPSRTIHLANNVSTSGLIITINNSGVLDLRDKGFTNTISVLQGEGTLKLASNQMPSASQNNLVKADGGTVEYNVSGASFILNNQSVYNNLTINLTSASNKAVLMNNLTIHGNLNILRGNMQIFSNDASATIYSPIILDIKKNLFVSNNGGILTGTASTTNGILPTGGTTPGSLVPRYYDIYHKVYIGGNFYNNGIVKFISNDITTIDFQELTTRGAATVRFYGIENSVMECSGITDFYNLIIDKGSGISAELSINATHPHNFRLFGANSYAAFTWGANPELRKALWIRNGTLRLSGYTTIPSLAEGRNITTNSSYVIPAFGAMVLDGPNVTVLSTADSPNEVFAAWGVTCSGVNNLNFPQELYVNGRLTINDGFLSTRFSGGIWFTQLGGELFMTGGKISSRQIRTTQAGTTSYIQSGGEVELLGAYTYNTSGAITTINDIRNAPIVYTYNATRLGGGGSFDWISSANVFKISNGTVNIYNTSGGGGACAIRILSDASNIECSGGLINLHITRNTSYDLNVPNGALPHLNVNKSSGTGTVRLLNNLSVNGNLVLNGSSELNTNTSNFGLSVSGNFIIGPTAIYNPNQNITRLFGSANSIFEINGTIVSDLFSLHIDKTEASVTLNGTNANINTRGDLNLLAGTLNDGGYSLTAKGNLFNSGIHTGAGKIRITEASVNRTIGGNGNGVWGNVELNETTGIITTLTANQKVNGNFEMIDGVMDLASYSLTLDGNLTPLLVTGFSETKMFRTSGNPSDGGLIRKITANGDYVFPMGTSNGTPRYTPTTITISDYSNNGYIQLNPVADELPLLNKESDKPALNYYWRARHSEFSTLPKATYLFKYSTLDVQTINADTIFVPGKVVGSTRSRLAAGVNTADNSILFTPAETIVNASYTAAHPERFDGLVPVFYSRICDSDANWDNIQTWSEVSHTGPIASRIPTAGDIVYIGSGGGCNIDGGGDYHKVVANIDVTIGELNFSPVAAGIWKPKLTIPQNRTINIDKISGAGTITLRVTNTQLPEIKADWGDFLAQTTSQVVYDIQNAGTVIAPALTINYPNLKIEAQGNTLANRFIVFDENITVRGDLQIDRGGSLLLNDGIRGNISVLGNTLIGGDEFGRLLFKGDGTPRTFSTNNLTLVNPGTGPGNQVAVQTADAAGLIHTLAISGNLAQNNGTIDLFTNNTGGSNAVLNFTGTANATFTVSGGTVPDLFRINVNKGTSQVPQLTVNTNFTIGAPSDIAIKPISLQNGTLILNNSELNLTLSTGGAYFPIPATAALILSNGKASITAHANGVDLQGRLRIENSGILSLGDGSTANRVSLQYQGLNPLLEIAGNGFLEVNSQIRRLTNSLAGSLKFRQTGGQVIIHGRDPVAGRAKFEVLNTGSEFTMSGGTITITRGGGTTFGDFYLTPASANVTGGEIIFSQGTINSVQSYLLNSSISLPNLTIAGNTTNNRTATVTLMSLPLQVSQTMKFENSLARFNTNNRNVTLLGNLIFQGLWTSGTTDYTYFNGSSQTITGSPTLNNVRVNSATSLTLQPTSVLTVNGVLEVYTPQLIDGGNQIIVKKDIVNNGNMVNSNPTVLTTGLKLRGGINQKISGSGTFGLIEIDNISGATLNNNISINNHLILTRGIFNIGSFLFSLGPNAGIIPGSPFSSDNMILTDGVFGSSGGVQKTVSTGSSSFTYPVGSSGKYTPVQLTVDANSAPGTILVKPVNQSHPTVEDANHVLQYYWVVESTGLSGFSGSMAMNYNQGDVRGNEAGYIGGRLTGYDWAKFIDIVNSTANTIVYPFTAINDLNGEYTAGVDTYIPNQVPLFISIASGLWSDKTIWSRDGGGVVPDGGPLGHRVIVSSGNTIQMNNNSRKVYTTTINGRLEIGSTYGHNLGLVNGTGTLAIETNQLPAGRYDDFFSCTGGNMEYGGSTSYTLSDRYNTFRNLTITGSGVKTMPNLTITICNNLSVNSGTLKISHFSLGSTIKSTYINGNIIIGPSGAFETDVNEYVYLKGNLSKSGSANFRNNYSGQRYIFNGTAKQFISGNLSGLNQRFFDLQISNPHGIEFDNNVEVLNNLHNISGMLILPDNYEFTLSKTDGLIYPISTVSYINGSFKRLMANGSGNSVMAIGKNNQYKPVTLTNRSNPGSEYWSSEFINTGFNFTSFTGDIKIVSNVEHFAISGPSSRSAIISLPLTGNSDVANLTINLADLRIARWNGTAWESVGGSVTITGDRNNGTVTTQTPVTFNGTKQLFTLATTQFLAFWTGSINNDWFNSGNWIGGLLPNATLNTTILSTANNPRIPAGPAASTLNLSINTGATVTVAPGGKLTVEGSLAVTDPSGLILENNTGINGMASLITKGSISGTTNIKLTLPKNQWYYLSSSISGATFGNFSPGPLSTIHVHRNNQWFSITSSHTNVALFNLEGVLARYNPAGVNQTLSYSGNLNTGIVTRSYSTSGWYLFGNPYPSFINWQNDAGWSRINISGTIWYRTLIKSTMAFVTYNRFAPEGARAAIYPSDVIGNEEELAMIPPSQSVWVKVDAPTSLSVNNLTRNHGVVTSQLKNSSQNNGKSDIIRIIASNSNTIDGAVIYFNQSSTNGFDIGDSEKRFNDSDLIPEVYTLIGPTSTSINGLPELDNSGRSIPLCVRNKVPGNVTLKFDLSRFKSDHSVELEDKLTGERVNLAATPNYTYSPKLLGDVQNRFIIHIGYVTTSISNPVESNNTLNMIDVIGVKGRAIVKIDNSLIEKGDALISVFTTDGQKVSEITTATHETLISLPRVDAVFVINVVAGGEIKTQKVKGKGN